MESLICFSIYHTRSHKWILLFAHADWLARRWSLHATETGISSGLMGHLAYLTTNQFKRLLCSRAQFVSYTFIGFDSITFLCNGCRDLIGCYNQSETYYIWYTKLCTVTLSEWNRSGRIWDFSLQESLSLICQKRHWDHWFRYTPAHLSNGAHPL